LVERIGFARTHVFPYSVRPGTEAAAMAGQVEPPVIKRRTGRMLETAATAERRFQKAQVGATVPVLWEELRDGRLLGTSDNYLRVAACAPGLGKGGDTPIDPADLEGELTAARLLGVAPPGAAEAVTGRILLRQANAPRSAVGA